MSEANDTLMEVKAQAKLYMQAIFDDMKIDYDATAKKYGVIEKVRELRCARVLLQLLFIYAMGSMSFRAISAIAYIMGECNISDEAWRQRFNKCEAWLCYLLSCSLIKYAPTQVHFCYFGQQMPVYLLDASTVKQVGKCGKELRLHTCYNLTRGAIEEVVITDNHTAEGTSLFKIVPYSLYIADAGYGKGKQYQHIISQNANALFRFTPNLVKLCSNAEGRGAINMVKRLSSKKKFVDFKCFVHVGKGKYAPVRIIASRLPDDKILLAKERKIRESKKKQTQIKDETLAYCQWVILMTNLDNSYSAESLLHIYRSRWQIELLFKRIKQFFNIGRIKKATLKSSKVLVLTWLLIWSIVEKDTIAAEIQLIENGADMERYSFWLMSDLFFCKFQTMLNSLWTLSFDSAIDLNILYMRLRNHKSTRTNQYAIYRFDSCSSELGLSENICLFNNHKQPTLALAA